MLKRLRRAIEYFLTLSKGERRGIIVLVILILLATAAYFLLPFFIKQGSKDYKKFEQEIVSFREEQQKLHDSAYIIRLQNTGEIDRDLASQKIKPFNFDPNKLPEEAWEALGLTEKQIKSIKKYEAKGGTFRSKKDVKKMYAISEAEYELLEPYIKIKSRFKAREEKNLGKKNWSPNYSYIEINKADSSQLVSHLKLAPWLAVRVIKYRNLLGGFYQKQQLTEVYGFDSIALVKRKKVIRVDETLIHKLDLNNSTFKQLVRHPYISYELTKYIVNTRKSKGNYNSIEQLKETPLVSESIFFKLKPYLKVGE